METAKEAIYILHMTQEQVKEVLNRVLTWSPERQADLVQVVALMEAQDSSGLRLTDAQAAEVRRRLANPSSEKVPAEDVFGHLRTLAK
ncbi:MAG TPA: hypothetical protein VFT69_01225 [Pseudolabrys sp.]|nr:hypothetical protein [Pseudolabrys sp.]